MNTDDDSMPPDHDEESWKCRCSVCARMDEVARLEREQVAIRARRDEESLRWVYFDGKKISYSEEDDQS